MRGSTPRARTAAPGATQCSTSSSRAKSAVHRIVAWYLKNVYGRFEGPGTVPYYCDSARVGHMAVDADALSRGDAGALFHLLVVLSMYQSRRDVDVMRRQREMPRREAQLLVSADALGRSAASVRCELLGDPARFDSECSVRRVFPSGHATCTLHPRTPCHVKRATMAIGRMGDLGKYPTSAWLHVGRDGGLPAAYEEACRAHAAPEARAAALVARLSGIYHIGRKLATMFVSAVSTPELAPGLAPWAPHVSGSSLVIVDANVSRVVDSLAPTGSVRTYAARETWVRVIASVVRLDRLDNRLPRFSPRFVQQALYSFRSRANRAARGDQCALTRTCADCVAELCPFPSK